MEAGSVEIIAGTGMIMQNDLWATIDEQLHDHSPEIGSILNVMVVALTPIYTGALIQDMQYEAYTSPGGYELGEDDLVWIYAADLAQQAYWNRVYVAYQEGGPLGLPTYTNDPHQMFYDVALGDGLAAVELWATYWTHYANELCVAGAGVPY